MGYHAYVIDKFMSTLGEKLRELRGASSQREMAEAVGIKWNAWARYEAGGSLPGAEMLEKICRVHACSADWLLGLPKSAAQTAAQSAAKSAPLLAHPLRGRPPAGGYSQTAAPGELPACAKCPFKEKVKAFEALARKPPGGH